MHFGKIQSDSIYNRVDSLFNILTNKITALIEKNEIKDIIDVLDNIYQLFF